MPISFVRSPTESPNFWIKVTASDSDLWTELTYKIYKIY